MFVTQVARSCHCTWARSPYCWLVFQCGQVGSLSNQRLHLRPWGEMLTCIQYYLNMNSNLFYAGAVKIKILKAQKNSNSVQRARCSHSSRNQHDAEFDPTAAQQMQGLDASHPILHQICLTGRLQLQ